MSAEQSNNSLEPTPVTKARFVWSSSGAAQLNRYAAPLFAMNHSGSELRGEPWWGGIAAMVLICCIALVAGALWGERVGGGVFGVLFGARLVYVAIESLRIGGITLDWYAHSRAEHPVAFWFGVGLSAVAGSGFILMGVFFAWRAA